MVLGLRLGSLWFQIGTGAQKGLLECDDWVVVRMLSCVLVAWAWGLCHWQEHIHKAPGYVGSTFAGQE